MIERRICHTICHSGRREDDVVGSSDFGVIVFVKGREPAAASGQVAA